MLAPEAWVVDEMVTPKRGPHSVGVERTFVPKLGRIVDNQRAFGVWLAAEDRSCPVNWRLLLPTEWAACPSRRRRAGIPESLAAEPPELCALNAALEMIEEWDIDRRPLIMDARNGDAPRLLAELVDRDVPFLIRIDDSVDLAAADPGGPPRPSHHLDDLLRRRCKPVEWRDVHGSARRRSPAATMPVSVTVAPATGRAPRGRTVELALLAEWSGRGQSPAARWLTNVAAPMAALVRLTKLAHQVANDFAEVSTTVGIQDFEGRSFAGWHRHVTLVSAAHAVLMTAQAAGGALIPRPRAHDDRVLAGSGAGGRP